MRARADEFLGARSFALVHVFGGSLERIARSTGRGNVGMRELGQRRSVGDAVKSRMFMAMYFNRNRQDQGRLDARRDQRRREDAAPRLRDVVPTLSSLRLHFDDQHDPGSAAVMPYTRHVVIATGAALFSVPCLERRCSGVHELTQVILRGLREAQKTSTGDSQCHGEMSGAPCNRTLTYVYEADFST